MRTRRKIKHVEKFPYFDMDADTTEDGRVYFTPDGPAQSVTTILSTLPSPELDAWRERVGAEEAKRVSEEASTIGSYMHEYIEDHLLGRTPAERDDEYRKMAWTMHKQITNRALPHVEEVWGVEVALHCDQLYAGRSDLIGVYRGKPAIMDHKTTKRFKDANGLKKYKLQTAAYAIAHENMFDFPIDTGAIFLSTRPNEEYNRPSDIQIVHLDEDEMYENKMRWMEILENFYA